MSETISDLNRTVFLGFARSGSSIAFSCLQRMYAGSGLSAYDLVADETVESVSMVTRESFVDALDKHEMVGCFRDPPPLIGDSPYKLNYVIIVRDPRDCFISWFHAAHLHDGVDKYHDFGAYLDAPNPILENSTKTLAFALEQGAKIIRYEDIYRDPALLFSTIIEVDSTRRFSRDAVDSAQIQLAMSQMVVSDYTHNRSGEPYQALRFQPKDVLDVLNDRFRDMIHSLNYPMDVSGVTDYPFRARFEVDSIKRYCIKLAEENHMRTVEIGRLQRQIDALNASATKSGGWLRRVFR